MNLLNFVLAFSTLDATRALNAQLASNLQRHLLAFSILTPLTAVAVVAAIALLLGFVIVLVFKFFAVEVDSRVEELTELLPGANCGGCGYSGCQAYAQALVSGESKDLALCTAGGQETAAVVAEFFGQAPGVFVPKQAIVHCQGSYDQIRVRYEYSGSINCATASQLFGGPGTCSYGCMGYGDCQRACEYGAIIIENGLAHIDPEHCIACGACVKACPRNLITIEPKYSDLHTVRCSNPLPGKDVRESCDIGCIGCTLCVKSCPADAIHMEEKLAVIDQDKCIQCGACAKVCPPKCIVEGIDLPAKIYYGAKKQ